MVLTRLVPLWIAIVAGVAAVLALPAASVNALAPMLMVALPLTSDNFTLLVPLLIELTTTLPT